MEEQPPTSDDEPDPLTPDEPEGTEPPSEPFAAQPDDEPTVPGAPFAGGSSAPFGDAMQDEPPAEAPPPAPGPGGWIPEDSPVFGASAGEEPPAGGPEFPPPGGPEFPPAGEAPPEPPPVAVPPSMGEPAAETPPPAAGPGGWIPEDSPVFEAPAAGEPAAEAPAPPPPPSEPMAPPSPPPEPPSSPGMGEAPPPTGLQAGDPLAASEPAPSGFSAPPAAPGAPGPSDLPPMPPPSPPPPPAPAPPPAAPEQVMPGEARAEGSIPPPGYTPSRSGYGGGPVPPGAFAAPAAAPSPAPAGVPLGQYQLASWGSRFAAYLIDNVLVLLGCVLAAGAVLALVLGGLGALLGSFGAGAVVGGIFGGIAGYFIGLFIQPRWMATHDGQTIGKQVLKIKTIRVNGQPVDLGWSMLRQIVVIWLLFNVVAGSFFIPWLLNYLWPLWDAENRALHDMLVGSRVVKA